MASQLDLDQGGTYRETVRVYMGPSVGWQEIPLQWLLNVTSGSATILPGTNLILVNFAGPVSIQLPKFKALASAQAIPRQFAIYPITICDVSGAANSNNITILPGAGETISGLASVAITSNFGAVVLRPDPVNGGSTMMQ